MCNVWVPGEERTVGVVSLHSKEPPVPFMDNQGKGFPNRVKTLDSESSPRFKTSKLGMLCQNTKTIASTFLFSLSTRK